MCSFVQFLLDRLPSLTEARICCWCGGPHHDVVRAFLSGESEAGVSVVNQNGEKILLPAKDPDAFWGHVIDNYAHRNQAAWRELAMLMLREVGGWTFDRIGMVFDVHPGTALRTVGRVSQRFRDEFCTDRQGVRGYDTPEDRDALIRSPDELHGGDEEDDLPGRDLWPLDPEDSPHPAARRVNRKGKPS